MTPLKVTTQKVDVYWSVLKCEDKECPSMVFTGHSTKDRAEHTHQCAKCDRVVQMARRYPEQTMVPVGEDRPSHVMETLKE